MKQFILAIAALFMFSAESSYACTCTMPEVSEAFSKARAVFLGEVTEIVKPRTHNPKAPLAERLYAVKFRVEQSWKGVDSLEVTILSDQGRAGCLSWGTFLKGEKYLVYAEKSGSARAPLKTLAVLFSCNRTASLAAAAKDIKELEEMSRPSYRFNRKRVFLWLGPQFQ
jgi:hypothetical protein